MAKYEHIGRYLVNLIQVYNNIGKESQKFNHILSGGKIEDFSGFAYTPEAAEIRDPEDLTMYFMVGVDNVGGAAKIAP